MAAIAHADAARIPSWFEFIRHPRLLGRPCQSVFAGGWLRQEKPLRFRAIPPEPPQPVRRGIAFYFGLAGLS